MDRARNVTRLQNGNGSSANVRGDGDKTLSAGKEGWGWVPKRIIYILLNGNTPGRVQKQRSVRQNGARPTDTYLNRLSSPPSKTLVFRLIAPIMVYRCWSLFSGE